MDNGKDKRALRFVRIWLITGLILMLSIVIIGAITRLTGSGLSMVEWGVVSGTLPPLSDEKWQLEFDKYKQFPEYQKVNPNMDLPGFKRIYFWEYLHRLLGRVSGFVFVIPLAFFLWKKWLSTKLIKRLVLIFCIAALQGVVGWLMVWSGLQDRPHVSHFRLAAHLAMALILMGVTLWTILDLKKERGTASSRGMPIGSYAPYVCTILVFAQTILGALVAGLKAGLSYNNFPLMEGTFLPPDAVIKSTPILYNGVVIQFVHRWMAFIVLAAIFWLANLLRSSRDVGSHRIVLLVLTTLQIIVGIFTLVLSVPFVLGVIHQLIAVLMLGTLIALIFEIRKQRPPVHASPL
jgi:heme a synthase